MSGRNLALALLVAAATACDATDDGPLAEAPLCRAAQAPIDLPQELIEASGVAVSLARPGVLWSHNDSGNEARLFAVDASGRLLGTVQVAGIDEMTDWEDITSGSCPTGNCLYIGDIGDNEADRDEIVVHRLAEPALDAGVSGPVESFRARYPDGPHDVEGLFLLPPERLFVVTKGGDGPIAIYEYPVPLRAGEPVTLRLVRTLSQGIVQVGDRISGASASADGEWVALRSYTAVVAYRASDLLGTAETPQVLVDVTPLGEPQGEGVALGPNGSIVLTSEGSADGLPGRLSILWCADLDR